uniref:Proteasome activator PA28 C-terminal domain-containing protein n=1 Tax=Glossina brevipalpis TaxID=37001 RepID=A0A1A9WB43_9MUSC
MDTDTKPKLNGDNKHDVDSSNEGKLDVYRKTEIDSVTQDKLDSVGNKVKSDDARNDAKVDNDNKIDVASKAKVINECKTDVHGDNNEVKLDADRKIKAVADSKVKIEEYKDSLIRRAEKIINMGSTEEILQLDELLATPILQGRKLNVLSESLNIPITASTTTVVNNHDNGSESDQCEAKAINLESSSMSDTEIMAILAKELIPSNSQLCIIINMIKPVIRKLAENSNLFGMWIHFMMPELVEGNDFRILIREAKLVETLAIHFFEQIADYFASRAEIVLKIAKNPRIDDYRRAIIAVDKKQCCSLSMLICEIKKEYLELYDLVKNMREIVKPRFSPML